MNLGKSAMRVAKTQHRKWIKSSPPPPATQNSIKGYSDAQTKVRDATSNDAWGPSGTQMSEIAALTYNQNDFVEIMEMLDKRLNDKGKNWRHVFKSLTLLDYCLHSGSENVVMYFRENIYIIKTLKEFQYIDEFGKDQGANGTALSCPLQLLPRALNPHLPPLAVRQKAKDITNLLLDEKRMRGARIGRQEMTDRMSGTSRPRSSTDASGRRGGPPPRSQSVPAGGRGEDRDLAAAIAASKASAEEEAGRGRRGGGDDELEEALRLSREEDERRKRELANQSGAGLFDEQRNNNLIDIDAAPQQPMMTGMPFQSFNPYAEQQRLQQEEWARQQQMMELQRQADEQNQYNLMLQQQAYAQQQQQAQEEYMRQQAYQQQQYMMQQQQQQQMQPLVPQPTAYGSNNPFAAFTPTPTQSPPPLPQSNSFSGLSSSPAPAPAAAPAPKPARAPKDDGRHAELARMLAGGREDGIDTFGNVGNMRVPVGAQFAQKTGMQPQATGARPNPFGAPQQQQQPTQGPNNPFFDI